MMENKELEWSKLKDYYDCVGSGWTPILEALGKVFNLILKNAESKNAKIHIGQVKEKFSGLRVYVSIENMIEARAAEVYGAIDMAEAMSFRMCEECGSTKEIESRTANNNKYGWLKTLCKNCHEKRDRECSKK